MMQRALFENIVVPMHASPDCNAIRSRQRRERRRGTGDGRRRGCPDFFRGRAGRRYCRPWRGYSLLL